VTIAPFPTSLSAQGPAAATSLPRLAAGFAFGALRGSAGRTRVPVFASLACTATLTATPLAPARHKHTGRGGAPSPARPRAHAARSAPRRDRGRARRRAVTVTRMLAPGRSTITLTGLARGAYRLSLTAVAAGGQVAHDRATLKVR
jgi:hypothetical protein